MATTIKLKNGSGAPAASDLVQGEPAIDLTNKRLYTENGSGAVIEVGSNPSSLSIGGTAVTATPAELNILDGVTSTTAELNILDGVTSTTAELNILDGVTSTAAELNILDGVTSTAAELNILDGVTSTAAELNILDGVTSTAAEINLVDGSAAGTVANSKAVIYGSSGEVNATTLQVGGVAITSTPAELNILDGVTSSAAELNILDGVTSTTAELNILDGVTSTASELNILDGVTSTSAELNILDGVTSTTAELNILDGVTSTTAELNILDGVTSTAVELNILDGVTATASELNILDGVTSTTAELNILDGVTSTAVELNILDGVTSSTAELNILDGKAFLDEDNMASNSATGIPSQQSVKAYVDANAGGSSTLADLSDTTITSPADAALLFYDTGTSKWIDNVVSGDITIADTGVAAIGSGVIVNADVKSDAAIDVSKTALVAGTGVTLSTNTLNVDASQTQITAVGTIGTGVWQGTVITNTYVADDLTINGGTIENSVIGASTAAAGTFTTFTSTGIDDNATSTAITIDASENVGIGESNPSARLHIKSNDYLKLIVQDVAGTDVPFSIGSGANSVTISNNASANTDDEAITFNQSAQSAIFFTAGAERMRIDSAGNVGIGTADPSAANLAISASSDTNIRMFNTAGTGSWSQLSVTGTNGQNLVLTADGGSSGSGNMIFRVEGNTERFRVDSGGKVLIGTTTASPAFSSSGSGIALKSSQSNFSVDGTVALILNRNSNIGGILQFRQATNLVGSVSVSASATAYNTSSDYRLKENIVDAPAGSIDAVRVRSFDWKVDGSHQTYGMVAQELVEVAPEAVSQGETDEDMWSVDYSKLVPMMIKEIQDLRARVAQLEGAN